MNPMITGIPVQKIVSRRRRKLSNLSNIIGDSLGQQEAVEKGKPFNEPSWFKSPRQTYWIIHILGQTGVGKTQLAKIP